MIVGERVRLRPITEGDWETLERWAASREGLWGPFQRFQLDHVARLREAFEAGAMLSRSAGFLIVELNADGRPIGFVRYGLTTFPDADLPHPEVGYGIADPRDRGQGYATEATRLLVGYLFDGYATERITAVVDAENGPSRRLLERIGFGLEGVMRRAWFRDGAWRDMALYGLLRGEWQA